MKYTTIEEIEAVLPIYVKSGAKLKESILRQRLAELKKPIPEDSPEADAEDMALRAAYEMYVDGIGWPKVTDVTGIKSPWIRVKKYAKDNNLPYGVK